MFIQPLGGMKMRAQIVGITVIVAALVIAGVIVSSQILGPIAENNVPQTGDATQPEDVTTGTQISIWDGTLRAAVANSGIYMIEDASHLAWVAASTNDGSLNGFTDAKIVLVNDIDLDNKE